MPTTPPFEPPEVEVTVPTVPNVVVVEWTHKLVFRFVKLPWSSEPSVKSAVELLFVPVVNAWQWLWGLDYKGFEMDWEASTFTVYYWERASPPLTIPALGTYVLAVCAILIAYGVVTYSLSVYQRERSLATQRVTVTKMLEEGKITPLLFILAGLVGIKLVTPT